MNIAAGTAAFFCRQFYLIQDRIFQHFLSIVSKPHSTLNTYTGVSISRLEVKVSGKLKRLSALRYD